MGIRLTHLNDAHWSDFCLLLSETASPLFLQDLLLWSDFQLLGFITVPRYPTLGHNLSQIVCVQSLWDIVRPLICNSKEDVFMVNDTSIYWRILKDSIHSWKWSIKRSVHTAEQDHAKGTLWMTSDVDLWSFRVRQATKSRHGFLSLLFSEG